jgi:hypothetical protein
MRARSGCEMNEGVALAMVDPFSVASLLRTLSERIDGRRDYGMDGWKVVRKLRTNFGEGCNPGCLEGATSVVTPFKNRWERKTVSVSELTWPG